MGNPMLECVPMMSQSDDPQETRKHASPPAARPAADPESEQTQVNPRVQRPAAPDESTQPTIRRERVERPPGAPDIQPPPSPPTIQRPPLQRLPGPQHARPVQKRRRKPGCLGQLGRLVLAAAVGLGLLLGVFAAVYFFAPPPRTNILILGVDARPGDGDVVRTDVMILATVDPKQPYVGMLSLPRDLWIKIPA